MQVSGRDILVRFFGICQHVSGMADIRGVLASVDPAHTVDDLTLSAHHWVMGRKKDSVPLLDGDGWRRVIEGEDWERFHGEWREKLDGYDAFLCFYPPVFAYLYRCFDKPIICQFPIRYEYPYQTDPQRWSQFNEYLRSGADRGRILLCANNPYDVAYGELFLQRRVRFVPSLCEYTHARWRPERAEVVYYSPRRIAELDETTFLHKPTALPRGHSWQDVARFRAIAHFPYNVSTMSIIEQYTMGVPLLFPTLDYAVSLYAQGAPLFGQNSWVSTVGGPPRSVITPPGGFPEAHDPNDFTSFESLRHWLRHADYYDDTSMPGILYFSSLEELRTIARESTAFYADVSQRVRLLHERRKERAIDGWRRILHEIS